MSEQIRPKHLEIYDFIIDFSTEHGYLPSIREICDGVGISSTSTVASHLDTLGRMNLVTRENGKHGYLVQGLKYAYTDPKLEPPEEFIGITENRLHHILGVARKAYAIAKERGHGEEFARKMFMIGWCHDVGYEFSKKPTDHPNRSVTMMLLLNDSCTSNDLKQNSIAAVRDHGKYIEDATEEWTILNMADLLVSPDGRLIDVKERLDGIKERYGEFSDQYLNACDISYEVGLTTINPAITTD